MLTLKLKSFLLLCFIGLWLTACDKSSNFDWTILVYLDGDNDLAQANLRDMAEMANGSVSERLRILVQLDLPDSTPAKRYEIKEGKTSLIADIGEVDMSAQNTLYDFLVWAKKQDVENSKYLMLVLSDHGAGWDQHAGPSPAEKVSNRALFVDWDSQGQGKNIPVLHNHRVRDAILESNLPIDILGLDASIMGTIEAIYEFSDLAEIIISSQEVGYAEGWDYEDIFKKLSVDSSISPNSFAEIIVNSYRDYFEKGLYIDSFSNDQSYSIAAHRSEKIQAVVDELDQLAELWQERLLIGDTNALSEMQAMRFNVQEIDPATQFGVYIDLKDMMHKLDASSNIPNLIDEATLYEYHGKDRPSANGLSIVFFQPEDAWAWGTCDPSYKDWDAETETGNKGKFINQTQWNEMLASYYAAIVPTLSDFDSKHPCNALFES